MTIHKKPVEEKEHDSEKYRFMKEQVRPQQKKNAIKYAQKAVSVIVLALIFGSAAGAAFYFVQSRLGADMDFRDYLVETVRPEATGQDDDIDGSKIVRRSVSQSDIDSITNYDHVSKKMAAIGSSYKYALVKVKGVMADNNWKDVNSDDGGVTFGAIFSITRNEYIIVTDSSAVNGTDEVSVEFFDGTEVKASVINIDSNINIAALRVDKTNIPIATRRKAFPISVGSVSGTTNGSNVIAVGAPNGIMYSVMLGKVIKSDIEVSIIDNQLSMYSTDMVSTSISNGIILNTDGNVIGIISNHYTKLTGEKNISFVSINSINDMIELLMRGKNVAYMGMEGKDVDSAAAAEHSISRGIYVTAVYSSSPAYAGGMRVADVVEKIDGISVKTVYALHNVLIKHKSGDEIKVEVSRKVKNKRKNITLSITLS